MPPSDTTTEPSNKAKYAGLAGVAEEAAGPLLTMIAEIPDVQKQLAVMAAWIDGIEKNPAVETGLALLKKLFPNEF